MKKPRSHGISRLMVIFIVDLVVVALASGGFLYIQSLPRSATFKASDLMISREEVVANETIAISVKITNTGEQPGNHTVTLTINQITEDSQTVHLEPQNSTTIEFTTSKQDVGVYYVDVDGLTGSFAVVPPKSAEFSLSDLTISREEAGINETVTISVKITNTGEQPGNHTVTLTINQITEDSQTVHLEPQNSTTIEFTTSKQEPGTYFLDVGGLTGTLTIYPDPPPPRPAAFIVTNLDISRDEALPNQTITISAEVTNIGELTGNHTVTLTINQTIESIKTVTLAARRSTVVTFSIAKENFGIYIVEVNKLTGSFMIVEKLTPRHTLRVRAVDPMGQAISVTFSLNGVTRSTPFSAELKEGIYIVAVSQTSGLYTFAGWQDGSENRTRTVELTSDVTLTASYIGRSCPSLYVWNGAEYLYVTEVSDGTGYLGVVDYFEEDGSPKFSNQYYYPWDYVKLDSEDLAPKNGYYEFVMTQRWDEIFYLDSATLLIVDHSSNVEVYSTEGEQYLDPEYMGRIYTVSKTPLTPVSCVDGEGKDCLPEISYFDGIYTEANNYQYDTLELDLGDLSDAEEIKLLVAGAIIWPSGKAHGEWCEQFVDQPGVPPFPHPYMEVKDENGSWIRVPDSRQFPKADVTMDTYVIDLTGLFPTDDYSLRINVFWNAVFDYIAVDITPQRDVTIHKFTPTEALLHEAFKSNSTSKGNFTRYGEVTQLIQETDDKFIVGRQGDEVVLRIPIGTQPQTTETERDYFLFVNLWFKDGGLPFLNFTVNPLPFQNMTAFPYSPPENYPYDEEHRQYLADYNTRRIGTTESNEKTEESIPTVQKQTFEKFMLACFVEDRTFCINRKQRVANLPSVKLKSTTVYVS